MSKGKDQLKNEKKFKILKKRASKNIRVKHRYLPTNTIDEILKACLIIERKAVFAF